MRRLAILLLFVPVLGSESNRDPRQIIGGQEASVNEYPFVVYISAKLGTVGRYCTGTVIAANWVVTAAHCVSFDNDPSPFPTALNVVKIEHGYASSYPFATRWAADIILHPEYDDDKYRAHGRIDAVDRYDVALIRVEEPFPDAAHSLIGLATASSEAEHVKPGSVAYSLGYGDSGRATFSTGLGVIAVPAYPPSDCRSILGYPEDHEIVHDQVMCAGEPGKRIGLGDSGGPLAVRTASGSPEWLLVGVAAKSNAAVSASGPGSLFTRVSAVSEWILSESSVPLPEPPPGPSKEEILTELEGIATRTRYIANDIYRHLQAIQAVRAEVYDLTQRQSELYRELGKQP